MIQPVSNIIPGACIETDTDIFDSFFNILNGTHLPKHHKQEYNGRTFVMEAGALLPAVLTEAKSSC
ncbi:MAG: hypothetical protein J7K46_08765 [Bacteroidales bacterium]|nr:hypothetical protein [Bacteroidales bacterium]